MRTQIALVALVALVVTTACTTGTGGDPPEDAGAVDVTQTPPEGDAALKEWLAAGHHEDWACQPDITDGSPSSVHGRKRVCFNDALADTPTDIAYPIGAAAVKEIYDDEDVRTGTTVLLKVKARDEAASWYWYERSGDFVLTDSRDSIVCSGCHASARDEGGHEYVYNRP